MIDLESYVKNERDRIDTKRAKLAPQIERLRDELADLQLADDDIAAVERVMAKAAQDAATGSVPVDTSEQPSNVAPRRRRAAANGHEAEGQPRKRVTKPKSALGEQVCAVLQKAHEPLDLEDIRLRLLDAGVETRNNHIKVALSRYLRSGEVVMYGDAANPAKQTFVAPRRSEETQAAEQLQPGPQVPWQGREWPGTGSA